MIGWFVKGVDSDVRIATAVPADGGPAGLDVEAVCEDSRQFAAGRGAGQSGFASLSCTMYTLHGIN